MTLIGVHEMHMCVCVYMFAHVHVLVYACVYVHVHVYVRVCRGSTCQSNPGSVKAMSPQPRFMLKF